MTAAQAAETLLEQFINIQASSHAFRVAFQSHATTQIFVNAYRGFVTALAGASLLDPDTIRILEKMSHFALSLSLDVNVVTSQKEDVGRLKFFEYAYILIQITSSCPFFTPQRLFSTRCRHSRHTSILEPLWEDRGTEEEHR